MSEKDVCGLCTIMSNFQVMLFVQYSPNRIESTDKIINSFAKSINNDVSIDQMLLS